MAKVGDKYVIEIDEVKELNRGCGNLNFVKGFNNLSLDDYAINRLNTVGVYERNAFDRGYEKGYEEGLEEGRKTEKVISNPAVAFDKGVETAWEAAKKIALLECMGGYPKKDLFQIFNCPPHKIFSEFSGEDAIRLIEEYEKTIDSAKAITNADKFKEVFGIDPHKKFFGIYSQGDSGTFVDDDWLNGEYKEPET